MLPLKNNPILTSYQTDILTRFFASPLTANFFLTGGTALAAFYFAHRESRDPDLFCIDPFDMEVIIDHIRDIATKLDTTVSAKVAAQTYQEIYLIHDASGWQQRIDIVREQPKHFGEIVSADGIRIDSLENIGSNKILTLFGRIEPKDYIDFYVIMQRGDLSFDDLFILAKQKDTGLNEFYLANSLAEVERISVWSPMKIPFNPAEIVEYYQKLSRELFLRVKPIAS
ncbi:MAG: nucleotidyl transferase AbiEii/AbiGii toxin family protein [Candidatus Aenigmarchaeota archaeon]|nr:nucleotidyl transferase AbiEii/AbiGii toxin family protein [Candidatus Aenigmarchaeota archaeon]